MISRQSTHIASCQRNMQAHSPLRTVLFSSISLLAFGHGELPALDALGTFNLSAQFPYGRPEGLQVVSFSDEQKAAAMATPIDWSTDANPIGRRASTNATSQGRCATCAFFAGVAAAEGAWAIGDTADLTVGILPNTGHPLVKLSEQELIDCKNNAGYGLPYIREGIDRAIDAPLANHSDPNITGCRFVTNCSRAAGLKFAYINGTRGPITHNDVDILPMLAFGPMAVSINANAYGSYHGGVLNCSATGSFHVDHANALVGYGVEPAPQKCATQPANKSFTTFCDTAFVNGEGGREDFGPSMKPPKGKVTLDECCAWCAAINPAKPAWNLPVCGAATWSADGQCNVFATDGTGHHLPGMAKPMKGATSCIPFLGAPGRAHIATAPVPYWKVKNSWGAGFGDHGYARFLWGNNCIRGAVQPFLNTTKHRSTTKT